MGDLRSCDAGHSELMPQIEIETIYGWIPGTLIGDRAAEVDEDFRRLDVRTEDGRVFLGCSPSCVRPRAEEAARSPMNHRDISLTLDMRWEAHKNGR